MNIIMWQALAWPAVEHCTLVQAAQEYIVTGYINGLLEQQPFAVRYAVHATPDWKVSSFHIQSLSDTRQLTLVADLQGHWFDRDGNHIEAFDGCIDIDITLTPFSNTLPVRRLQLEQGQRSAVEVIYIHLPAFELEKATQYYTRLEKYRYRFEQPSLDYTTELPLDEQYIVKDYPALFKRIYP